MGVAMPLQQAFVPFALPGVVTDSVSADEALVPCFRNAGELHDQSSVEREFSFDPQRKVEHESWSNDAPPPPNRLSVRLMAACCCIAIVFAGATMCVVVLIQTKG